MSSATRKASVVNAGNSLRSTDTGHCADQSATRRDPRSEGTVSFCNEVNERSYPAARVTGLSAPNCGGRHAGGGDTENGETGAASSFVSLEAKAITADPCAALADSC